MHTVESLMKRVGRLAKQHYRDVPMQMLAMIELYEQTHKVSSKIKRKRRKKAVAVTPETKKESPLKGRKRDKVYATRSDKGKKRSEQARKNIALAQRKRALLKRLAEAPIE